MSNLVKNGAENQAWRDKSNDLAQWAIAHLYARTDAFPEWNGQQWFCKKEAVTADHLAYHFRGSWTVGTYTIKPTEETCVYTAWDIDCHDLAADPDENWKTAETLYHRLFALGLRPILEDSNGDGGYHVWVIWDRPVSAALALSFGRWIVQDATVEVEVFPKQPQVGILPASADGPGRHAKHLGCLLMRQLLIPHEIEHFLFLLGQNPDLLVKLGPLHEAGRLAR